MYDFLETPISNFLYHTALLLLYLASDVKINVHFTDDLRFIDSDT